MRRISKKGKIMKIMMVLFLTMLYVATVSGLYAAISVEFPSAGNQSIAKVDNSVKKVWGTVTLVVQVLAFTAVIFAGLRYMFASANQKADIKKGMMMLAIGSVLVFAASTVVQFIVNVSTEVFTV